MLDEKLLDIICCPKCKGNLTYDKEKKKLICELCSYIYSIKDGIPIMLTDESAENVEITK